MDHNEATHRLWTSPNGVDHLVIRKTGKCVTCGRLHQAYERVTYHPEGGRRRSVLLRVTSESDLLVGTEVDEAGETKWTARGTTTTIHMIDRALIDKRELLVLSHHYGLLVDPDTGQP